MLHECILLKKKDYMSEVSGSGCERHLTEEETDERHLSVSTGTSAVWFSMQLFK